MANDTLIDIEDLTKIFYTDEVETHALSGIHLTISRGEYLAMSGPSGCGKSTLLSILGLLDTPTGGRYLLNGKPVENLSFSERSRIRNQEIGFIFQSFNLIGDLTVEENVELPLTYRAGMPSAERKKRVKEALERVTGWRSAMRAGDSIGVAGQRAASGGHGDLRDGCAIRRGNGGADWRADRRASPRDRSQAAAHDSHVGSHPERGRRASKVFSN